LVNQSAISGLNVHFLQHIANIAYLCTFFFLLLNAPGIEWLFVLMYGAVVCIYIRVLFNVCLFNFDFFILLPPLCNHDISNVPDLEVEHFHN
jgi:hypothetical protein